MKEVNSSNEISAMASRSLVILIGRTSFLQIFSLIGIFFLTQYLSPTEFGVFFLVNELVGILTYFSDVGLSASLIQQKSPPNLQDLRTSFTIQQLLFGTLSLISLSLSPLLYKFYHWDHSTLVLWIAVIVGFLMASLKTIPSVIIERSLRFEKLVMVETVETILFYSIAVMLAIRGWGIASYTVAVLCRGLAGLITIYIINPWPVGFAFDRNSIHKLFKFGVPYQVNTIIAAIKDRLLNVILGGVVGTYGLGLLGWAQTWSQKPLRFISDNVTRVTFPAFARLQDDPEKLKSALVKMFFFSAASVFPFVIGAAIILSPLTQIIPRYDKWQPGIFLFYLYTINSLWAAISTPATNALAAIGHIKIVTKLMIMWTVLTWGVVAPLGIWFGYQGVAIGVSLISFASIIPIFILHQKIPFSLHQAFHAPFFATILMILAGVASLHYLQTPSITTLFIIILICATTYLTALKYLAPRMLAAMLSKLYTSIWQKSSSS